MEQPKSSFKAMREGRVFDENQEYNDQRITPLAIRGASDKGFETDLSIFVRRQRQIQWETRAIFH